LLNIRNGSAQSIFLRLIRQHYQQRMPDSILYPDPETAKGSPMRVIVHVAARIEWKALLVLLPGLPPVRACPVGEYTMYAPDNGVEFVLVRGGVGKIHAAAASQYAILRWQPDLYGLIGTAGAVDPDLAELDLVLVTRALVHDMLVGLAPVAATLAREHTTDLTDHWGDCVFPYPLRRGTAATGDADVTAHNINALRSRYQATVADWETAAIAKVCAANNTPALLIRGVTDRPYGPTEEQHRRFLLNTPLVMERAWETLLVGIEHLR
jgi:adenosylhomocysteine nucleosidase